ncbi:MAG: S9 family peptidase [Candidatus Aminicenantes bacterium]|nr:S9 family peptidase [Candidatus Aminicenantes bacterium]
MKKHLPALTTIFILFAPLFLAAQSKPLVFDDFIKIKRVTDPQPSPDGQWIAFVITVMDKNANRGNSDIWLVSTKGGEPQRLTASPQADMNPRWSPDGKKIAFISTRSGSPQVWIISPNGGEAYQLTNLSTGASGVIWSPDGKRLSFTSSVYPDCPDDECNKKKAEAWEKSRVKARIYDTLFFRYWNAWRDETRSHLFVIPAEGGKAVDVTPGDYDTPPLDLGGNPDYAFSPDGTEIAFVRNIDPELKLALGTNNDVFITSLKSGEIKPVTTNKGNDNLPVYSPDGKYIAYRAMARPGYESDKLSLMRYDRTTKKIQNLTENLDYSVNEMLWFKDSSGLYFDADEKGRNALFKVTVSGGKAEKILEGHTFNSLSLLPDGKTFIFLKQAMNRPSDIFAFDSASKKLIQITDVNKELLAQLQLNPAEEFWFEGADKDKVHGWLLKPPAFDPSKNYPLVLLIHGGPHGPWKDEFHYRWNAQMFASPGYVTALINFHASSGYGQRFSDAIVGDWGGRPYQDIMKGLDYLLTTYAFLDKTKLGAAGASYGGYMIDWIEGQTTRFNCLISHDGVFDLRSMYGATEELWFPEWEQKGTPWTNAEQYTKWSPSYYVKNFKTPCLVVHSQNDYRVPLEQGLQFFTSLQRMNVPSKFLYFPDEDHFITKPQNAELWWKTVLDWLAAYLKK